MFRPQELFLGFLPTPYLISFKDNLGADSSGIVS